MSEIKVSFQSCAEAIPLKYVGRQDSGLLYAASAGVQGPLPAFEMAETRWFSELPEELTYPEIQPLLWRQARQVRGQGNNDELSQMTDIFNE